MINILPYSINSLLITFIWLLFEHLISMYSLSINQSNDKIIIND